MRSARRKRTITLRVLRGAVEVLAPKRTPKRDIREFVEAKSAWVLDKLANPPVRAQVTPFGHGDTVPYLGYTRPVVVQSGTTKTVEVSLHDHFCGETDDAPDNLVLHHFHVTVPEGIDDEARPQRVRTALARWYSARAEANGSPRKSRSGFHWWRPRPSLRCASATRGRNGGAAQGTEFCASVGGA